MAPSERLTLAARNIAASIGNPPSGLVQMVCTPDKAAVAEAVGDALKQRGLRTVAADLTAFDPTSGFVVLMAPQHAPAVFAAIGRPDQGVKVPEEHLFCDWFISTPGLIRTYGIDVDEQERFRAQLLSALEGARRVRVTTALGTDITLVPRPFRNSWGEVYTSPMEYIAEGTIVIDGALYWRKTSRPVTLQVRAGRVANLSELNLTDPQQKMLFDDLTRDANANVLAELGIGVNLGADPAADLMEAEQARSTVHFGFGNTVAYGGQNASSFHGDVGVLAPTIEVDGRVICREGVYFEA